MPIELIFNNYVQLMIEKRKVDNVSSFNDAVQLIWIINFIKSGK